MFFIKFYKLNFKNDLDNLRNPNKEYETGTIVEGV